MLLVAVVGARRGASQLLLLVDLVAPGRADQLRCTNFVNGQGGDLGYGAKLGADGETDADAVIERSCWGERGFDRVPQGAWKERAHVILRLLTIGYYLLTITVQLLRLLSNFHIAICELFHLQTPCDTSPIIITVEEAGPLGP